MGDCTSTFDDGLEGRFAISLLIAKRKKQPHTIAASSAVGCCSNW